MSNWPGADVIGLQANTIYTLTTANNETDGPNGLPSVTSTLIINGNGATIARSVAKNTPDFRIVHVDSTGDLTLNDVTIYNGKVSIVYPYDSGGGICNSYGAVTVNHSTVSNNTAYAGGGIRNYHGVITVSNSTLKNNIACQGGIYNLGPMVLNNSIVYRNTVNCQGHDAGGGGIKNHWEITINSSIIENNVANHGGGIANENLTTLNNSTIIGNVAANGGGIHNVGRLVVMSNSLISRNSANSGGGVYNLYEATMSGTVSSNTVSNNGGGLYSSSINGFYNSYGIFKISDSTVNGNMATNDGGGIYNNVDATLLLTNSTISGNATDNNGGGIYNTDESVATLSYSTIANNVTGGKGGGIYQKDGSVNIVNTILAKNSHFDQGMTAQSFEVIIKPDDCTGNLISRGYNLIQNSTDCIIGGNNTGNLMGLDPLLGPLANNGGHTLTHALLQDSPAIDAGNSTLPNLPLFDQRGMGFRRVMGRRIDIGSFESTFQTSSTIVVQTPDPNIKTDGQCSLIEAIVNANNDAKTYADCPPGKGDDTISLQADIIYTLTMVNNDTDGPNGLPSIASTISISGNRATIMRSKADNTPGFRIFHVGPKGDLTLNEVTIRNGKAPGTNSIYGAAYGGGIYSDGLMIINNSIISGNVAYIGGGIRNYHGSMVINNCLINSNIAFDLAGGIANGGAITINSSTISNNMTDITPVGVGEVFIMLIA